MKHSLVPEQWAAAPPESVVVDSVIVQMPAESVVFRYTRSAVVGDIKWIYKWNSLSYHEYCAVVYVP